MSDFLKNRIVFYGQALAAAKEVGAFSFTSNAVAEALVQPIVANGHPLKVLEVGPGTGAITRHILKRLGPDDRLDLYEINAEFVKILRGEFGGIHKPEVNIVEGDISQAPLPDELRYDVIVSSLPLLNMPPDIVRRIFSRLVERLSPDGIWTYYDYWGKEIRRFMGRGRERRRMREVLSITREFLERHEVRRRVIPWNVPPGLVHVLKREKKRGASARLRTTSGRHR